MVRVDNAEELASMAREVGAEVIDGQVHCRSDTGAVEVGGVDIGKQLCELRGQAVMLIVLPLSPVREPPPSFIGEPPALCWVCGTKYYGKECPTCNAQREKSGPLGE